MIHRVHAIHALICWAYLVALDVLHCVIHFCDITFGDGCQYVKDPADQK